MLVICPLVFLGDSITDDGNWDKLFPNLSAENRGIGGDSTLGLLNRLDQIIALQPSQIFLMIGAMVFILMMSDISFGVNKLNQSFASLLKYS